MKVFLRLLSMFSVMFPLFLTTVARAEGATLSAANFVDASTYYSEGAGTHLIGLNSYFDALESLKRQFDYVCGDTFCEGDFSNLKTLSIDCSIDQAAGKVGECAWTIAGSYADVDAQTGHLEVHQKTYVCKLPVAGSAEELANFLVAVAADERGAHGLTAVKLPGNDKSAYDVLAGCI